MPLLAVFAHVMHFGCSKSLHFLFISTFVLKLVDKLVWTSLCALQPVAPAQLLCHCQGSHAVTGLKLARPL